jgi:hypothetical protein
MKFYVRDNAGFGSRVVIADIPKGEFLARKVEKLILALLNWRIS